MPPEKAPENVEQLLRTGNARGYVLYDEIDNVLPSGREGIAELDMILSKLTNHAIDIVDEPRTEDSIPDENFFEQVDLHDVGGLEPLRIYLREVLTVPHLTVEQEKELAKRVNCGGEGAENAENRLIEANLWIVVGTAMHFLNSGVGPLELVQEGNIGLMRAVREYNHMRPYRFSIYATWWVRKAIQVAIRRIESPE